jgi:hypothetical protein
LTTDRLKKKKKKKKKTMSKKTGQDGLLQWAQNVTSGYKDVQVDNFTMSFKDGLAFCAIVHHYRPDLLDFAQCHKSNPLSNHNKAFDAAEQCGVPRLLDAEDFVDLPKPDRLSVITYLSEMYHGLAKSASAAPRKFGGLASVSAEAKSTPAKRPSDAPSSVAASSPASDDQQPTKRRPTSASLRPCAKCGEPLSGTVAEFEGVGFHVACFGCFTCGKSLKSECIAVNGKPYCDLHGKEAFLASKRPPVAAAVDSTPLPSTTNDNSDVKSTSSSSSSAAAKLAGGMASLRDKLKPSSSPKAEEPPKPLPKKQSPTKPPVAVAAPIETPAKPTRKIDDGAMPAWKRKRLEEEEREKDRKANEEAARQAKIAQLTGAPVPVPKKPVAAAASTPIVAASPPRVTASPPRVTASPPRVASPPRAASPPPVDESSTDVAAAAAAAAAAISAAESAAESHAAASAAAAAERMRAEAAEAEERERELLERQRRATAAATAAADAEAAVRARAQTEAAAVSGPPPQLPSKRASSAVAGKCSQCNVSVFERERVDYDGLLYHRNCYRCAVCARRGGNGPSDLKLVVREKRLLCTSHLVEATKSIVASTTPRNVLPPPDAKPDWAGAFQRAAVPGDEGDDVFDGPPDGPPPSLPPKRRATTAVAAAAPSSSGSGRPPTIVIRSYTASEYEEMTAAQQRQEAAALALQVPETLEGYLLKKGDIGIIKGWKRRLFVMREDCIAYYRDMEHRRSEILQGVIPLRGCTVCSTPQTVPGSFQINAPSRIWLLQATTPEEAQRWIKNLRIASARATMKAVIKGEAEAPSSEGAAPATGDAKPRRRERAAMKEGLVHVMQGVNNQWKAQWLVVRDGVLSVHANEGDKPYIKIPLYRCGMAEYDKNNPPPNLGFDFFGSLRRLVVNEQITDFRNTFQVCGANRSVVIQTETIETMHGWLNAIVEHKLFTESIIDSIEIDW